ncbi:TIGR01244 family phosphatase [Reyranella sp. MMS21-HV4-11]|uniref:TIGR01244 family phosphatase n=1 Tax=Reyranella humidisoli TaxID=2849149 RepID=A0ABS6IHG5_9HYPH|nr:TIGR01244 family sulfur transferase [Reyranella sp. MMS21-HV4-11]MBU8872733.1 TIGR01244 family phosphatase [Reyranella sp. MMS21-HV4-11]
MSLSLLPVDDNVSVSGQLTPADMKEIAGAGFTAVVNNRPDGEALYGQPRTADLRAAAEAAGLQFLDLPFSGPRATPDQVRALADLLAGGDGRVVAFCKSGMRSALLWGAASLANGRSLEEVLQGARKAGQELSGAADLMTGLAQAARS